MSKYYEHATSKEGAVIVHMKKCPEIQNLSFLFLYYSSAVDKFNSRGININLVNDIKIIIDSSDKWGTLLFSRSSTFSLNQFIYNPLQKK